MKKTNYTSSYLKLTKTSQPTKTELLHLQKHWEQAEKRINQNLTREKNQTKKKELQLIADFLKNNFIDLDSKAISNKWNKKVKTDYIWKS